MLESITNRIPTRRLHAIGQALERSPAPVRALTAGLRRAIWGEVWGRNLEAELVRRGFLCARPRGARA